MKNLISRISQIFPTSSRKENYVRILKFLEKDAENCYDSVVGKYVDISANKLKKAIEFVYETDKSNSSLILFPCLRMPKYKIILNFFYMVLSKISAFCAEPFCFCTGVFVFKLKSLIVLLLVSKYPILFLDLFFSGAELLISLSSNLVKFRAPFKP